MHGLQDEFGAAVGFVYLDIDDRNTAELKKALGYRGQPHYFLVNPDGSVRQAWRGVVDAQELHAAVAGVAGG